jgi:hypothetical protein
VILQLVGREDGPQIGGGTSVRRQRADKRTAFAASLRKDDKAAKRAGRAEAATAVAEPQEPAIEADAPEEKKDE